MTRKWRKREHQPLKEKREWQRTLGRSRVQTEKQIEENRDRRYRDEQWRKKNDKWRQAKSGGAISRGVLLINLRAMPTYPSSLSEARSVCHQGVVGSKAMKMLSLRGESSA